MRRLLLVAYHYPPSLEAGSHRSARFSRLLPSMGWEVDVLTVEAIPDSSATPGHAGVRIHRTSSFLAANALLALRPRLRRPERSGDGAAAVPESGVPALIPPGRWQRFKDTVTHFLRYPDPEAGWIPFAIARGRSIVKKDRIDVIVTSGPPHSSHLVGWALRRGTGCRWVADFRDPWSTGQWKEPWERRGWRDRGLEWLESKVIRSADRVVLNTVRMCDDFRARYPDMDPARFRAIPNGFDPEEFAGLALAPRVGPFRLTHAGSLDRQRNILVLLRAIRRLLDQGVIPVGGFELLLIGRATLGDLSLEAGVTSLGLDGVVRHVPSLPHNETLASLLGSDGLLVVQPGVAVTQVPSKLYEYLYVNKPVLALAHPGATADLVRLGGLGPVADPDREDEVADALLELYRSRGKGPSDPEARERLLALHDVRALARSFESLLRECVGTGEAAPSLRRGAGLEGVNPSPSKE